MTDRTDRLKADRLLLSERDIEMAIGPRARVELERAHGPASGVGDVVRSAAADSAYKHCTGRLVLDDATLPLAVGMMALIFGSTSIAEHMFGRVAEAAHLRTHLDGANVAVETVTGTSGMVSYWGFVQRDQAMVIVTLDTVDPQHLSVADLRSLVKVAADRLQLATQQS